MGCPGTGFPPEDSPFFTEHLKGSLGIQSAQSVHSGGSGPGTIARAKEFF